MIDFTGINGLTQKEVNERIIKGEVNKTKENNYDSHLKIILKSFFNFYNIILYILGLIILFIQLFVKDGLNYFPITKYGFLIIILINASFSIFSYERSRLKLKKLSLLNKSKVYVLRDNKLELIDSSLIVIDDIIYLNDKNISEVPVDLILIKGEGSFNESILTGESSLIKKNINDEILSGSSLIKGELFARVIRIKEDTYVKKIENETKSIKKKNSKLSKDINKIIFYMVLLLPLAIILIFLSYIINKKEFNMLFALDIATLIVGMTPIGLVLLSSLTLSNSIFKLAKENVLVRDLYAIENLSRVNLVALDKTGTLTTNNIIFKEELYFKNNEDYKFYLNIVRLYLSKMNDNNTSIAIKNHYKDIDLDDFINKNNIKINNIEYFDSIKKYSSLTLNNDTYKLGATEYLLDKSRYIDIFTKVNEYTKNGYRCLIFTKNNEPIFLFVLENELRENLKETIDFFKKMNIKIKIITGDSLETSKYIAQKAGIDVNKARSIEGLDLDSVSNIAYEVDLFARSSPSQKEVIIKTLEEKYNYKVAYFGDGINDIISLRRATCSVSFNLASESAKKISDFVLVDDDFKNVPMILNEGRRVVNNIKRTCSLFVTKNIALFLFALYSLFSRNGLPISIESIYIYEFIDVALCGFLLSIENNTFKEIKGDMVKDSLIKGVINAFYLSFGGFILTILSRLNLISNTSELISLLISLSSIIVLFNVGYPFSKYSFRVSLFGGVSIIFLLLFLPDVFLNKDFFILSNGRQNQIELIIKDIFNLSLYNKISLKEYIILFIIFILSSIIYLGINLLIKKKKEKKDVL